MRDQNDPSAPDDELVTYVETELAPLEPTSAGRPPRAVHLVREPHTPDAPDGAWQCRECGRPRWHEVHRATD